MPDRRAPDQGVIVRSLSAKLTAAGLAFLLAGCAGLFQRGKPAQPADYRWRAGGELAVGFAETDITPVGSAYLGGFGLARSSTGVHSRLKVRAMVLRVGARNVAVVGVDNLGLQREDVDWIKRALVGFHNGDVLLCSSHTHAAPDLVGLWGFYTLTSGRDVDYLQLVRRQVVDAVQAALGSARPAELMLGTARIPPAGVLRNGRRPGVCNYRATALVCRDVRSGEPFGALLHVACHPELLSRRDTLVSADFVGELCDRWRAAGHGQAVFV
ncbi:MAG: hypothetical protein KDC87_20295, partial [Planctomycetes bacterium]|nr:hypothetical protein [Planctomycetota bacterium]